MIQQGTIDWKMQRLGKVTASKVHDVIARTKKGYSASRENYLMQLLTERLTNLPTDTYVNKAMQWGIDNEPKARELYSLMTDNNVDQVSFINHPNIQMAGASPDGLVNQQGLIEIKCPLSINHLNFVLYEQVPDNYFTQMQWQMACTDRFWCDYVSYDPRFPAELQIKWIRVERDEKFILDCEKDVLDFIFELDEKYLQLRSAA